MKDWKQVLRRAQFGRIAMTPERAHAAGAQVHPDAEVVAELRPDDGPTFHMSFASLERLRSFVADMQPRSLTVECAPGEDAPELLRLAVGWAEGVQSRLRTGATVH